MYGEKKAMCVRQNLKALVLCLVVLSTAFAQLDGFETVQDRGGQLVRDIYELIKWLAVALGTIMAAAQVPKLMSEREDKMEVLKRIAWIPIVIILLFSLPTILNGLLPEGASNPLSTGGD